MYCIDLYYTIYIMQYTCIIYLKALNGGSISIGSFNQSLKNTTAD